MIYILIYLFAGGCLAFFDRSHIKFIVIDAVFDTALLQKKRSSSDELAKSITKAFRMAIAIEIIIWPIVLFSIALNKIKNNANIKS